MRDFIINVNIKTKMKKTYLKEMCTRFCSGGGGGPFGHCLGDACLTCPSLFFFPLLSFNCHWIESMAATPSSTATVQSSLINRHLAAQKWNRLLLLLLTIDNGGYYRSNRGLLVWCWCCCWRRHVKCICLLFLIFLSFVMPALSPLLVN